MLATASYLPVSYPTWPSTIMPKSRRQRTSRQSSAPSSARLPRPSTHASTRASRSLAAMRADPTAVDPVSVNDSRSAPVEDSMVPLSQILKLVCTEVQAEMQAIQRAQTPAPLLDLNNLPGNSSPQGPPTAGRVMQ